MLTFLQAVLPVTGNYVVHIENKSGGGFHKNLHADTLTDFVTQAHALDADPDITVFHALGAFENNLSPGMRPGVTKVGRTSAMAARFKTLAFDVDPTDSHKNVKYESQKAMAQTTLEACQTIGLPDPVFVSSGNGLHCYYPLTAEISKDMWVRISTMLKNALLSTGMSLDATKVCDPSMVLRPVGTHNKKKTGFKQVTLLSPLALFDPLDLAQRLMAYAPSRAVSVPGVKPKRTSAVMDAILASTEYPPSDGALVAQNCAQVGAIANSGGVVGYPLWWLGMGMAKHCINPRETAHAWSDQDPRYTPKGTDDKFDSWTKGPPTCKSFELVDSAVCAACPHRGKITSPIQLGVVAVSDPMPVVAGAEMKLPAGYMQRNGKLFRVVEGEAQFVSDYLMFPSVRYKDEITGKSMCLVEVKLPKEGWSTFQLPMDALAKSSEFLSWLMNNQLFVSSDVTLGNMRRYMLTYLQELQLETESGLMCSTFGWTDEDATKFVLGDRAISNEGTTGVRLGPGAADIAKLLTPKGDLAAWVNASVMFNEPGMALHAVATLVSMGSPLMIGSGLSSSLLNVYSEKSGTGKTTSALYALSMYGDPERMKLTVKDTDNSLFKTMGVYGNLPVYIDEITEVDRDRLAQIAFFITQGREKKRMTKEGGFQESVEWRSPATSTSNKNMYELLSNKMSFEGEAMRILQFTVHRNALFNSDDGSRFGYDMSLFLKRNYGLAGETFIMAILALGGPHVVFSRARNEFDKKFKFLFSGKERFWQANFVIAYAAGKILTALGLTKMDYEAHIRTAITEVVRLRDVLTESQQDCFDIIGQYVGEFAGKTVVFRKNTASTGSKGAVVNPPPHEAVARVEVLCTNLNPYVSGRLFINQAHFNQWAHDKGADRSGTMTQLINHGVTIHKDRRVALMRGTDKPLPAVRVYEIEMTHPRFLTIMQQHDVGIAPPEPLRIVPSIGVSDAAESS